MKISLNWLKEFVPVDLPVAELAEALTMVGLEVEQAYPFADQIKGVVTARIIAIAPHPSKEDLSVCQVTTGSREYQVVCGATNMKVGDAVPLALEGARLKENREIRKSKFRSVLSEGMLCSEAELGLGDRAQEILVLDGEVLLGEDLFSYFGLRDVIFDLSINPNRGDCLSVLGVAREVGAITGKELRYPEVKLVESRPWAEEVARVEIRDSQLCPRYSARILLGCSIRPSPLKMKARLQAIGLRPINNAVDATNYVMVELGQPLHAFDLELLAEKQIVVKPAGQWLNFITLDGQAQRLAPETLLICDGEGPVAIAGVMGGHNSEVKDQTRNILLEGAHFDPISIRRTSKRLKLTTEASLRFERGVDPEATLPALDRAAQLIQASTGAQLLQGVVDCYPGKRKAPTILFRASRASRIVGFPVAREEAQEVFQRLKLPAQAQEEDILVTVASFRFDLKEEIDLIEEVARLLGYSRVPIRPLKLYGLPAGLNTRQKTRAQIRQNLSAQGYLETINFAFISGQEVAPFLPQKGEGKTHLLEISNPLSLEQSVMRPSLIPGLLEAARRNLNRDITDLKLYELAKGFVVEEEKPAPRERWLVAGIATGTWASRFWTQKEGSVGFYDITGTLENLLEGLGIEEVRFCPGSWPFLHPGRQATLQARGVELGLAGEIHPAVLARFEISHQVYAFELEIEKIVEALSGERAFEAIPRYPFINRDLALVVEAEVLARDVEEMIRSVNPGIIREATLFDLYSGPPVPQGKKSLAFSLKFQAQDRTLTDGEVEALVQKIISLLSDNLGAKLRTQEERQE